MEQKKKKKIYIPVLAAAAVFGLCLVIYGVQPHNSCNEAGEEWNDPYAEVSVLPIGNVNAYCVDGDGMLYVSQLEENAIRKYSADGECLSAYPVGGEADGVVRTCAETETPRCLCMDGGKIYFFASFGLFCLDPATGETEQLWTPQVWGCELAVQGDTAAVLYYMDRDDCDSSIGSGRVENYWCDGTQLGLLNLKTLEFEDVEYHHLVTVEAMGEEGFLVEGFDEEHGFYLAEMSAGGVMGEREAAGFQDRTYLAWDAADKMFHAMPAFGGSCISGTLTQPQQAYRYWKNDLNVGHGDVEYGQGYLYLLNKSYTAGEWGTITRLKPELFFREAEPLKAYLCNLAEEPDWLGYPVEVEVMYSDELAMKLLAGDGDFDFVVLDSTLSAAWDMKRVEAYYPLNAVLEELLPKTFEGVQEFAVNGEDIWALPLSMNLQSIVYSEENLQKAGLTLKDVSKMSELVGVAEELYAAGFAGWYDIHARDMEDLLFQNYVMKRKASGKVSFDTEEFRALLDTAPGYFQSEALGYYSVAPEQVYKEAYDRMVENEGGTLAAMNKASAAVYEMYCQDIFLQLVTWPNISEYGKFIGKEQFALRPVPQESGEPGGYTACAELLVVNPASERREQAVRLAGKIAEQVFWQSENYLCADRSIYPGDSFSAALYDACAAAEITEVLPREVYGSIYQKAFENNLQGITLSQDEVIEELERVVNAYLFE